MAIEAGPEGFGHRLRPVERRDAATSSNSEPIRSSGGSSTRLLAG